MFIHLEKKYGHSFICLQKENSVGFRKAEMIP